MKKPIRLIAFSDMHTCGTTALHPMYKQDAKGKFIHVDNTGWGYLNNPQFRPSSGQRKLWEHLEKCLDYVMQERKTSDFFILSAGDAVDGVHHGTLELVTRDVVEQMDTHIQLMQYILKMLQYRKGDKLAYLIGTNTHVGDLEYRISKELGAYQFQTGKHAKALVKMDLNGCKVWAFHQGVAPGKYPYRGNQQINFMKSKYFECLGEGKDPPDLMLSGHFHDFHHATWTTPQNKIMHYVTLPSWQAPTRYVKDNMVTAINRVGLSVIDISANGEIKVNDALLMDTEEVETIKM